MSTLSRTAARVPDAVGRRARRRYARFSARSGVGLVLLYHRIAAPSEDPWQIAVSEQTFDRHLGFLASEYTLLPLAELVDAARRRRLPERALAISFDDGYADNLVRGLPLLEKHGIPATFYIATGYMREPREYWWDELMDAMVGEGPRPPRLELELGGERIAVGTETLDERRRALLEVLHPALRASAPPLLELGLGRICEWAGLSAGSAPVGTSEDPLRRPMTPEELASFAASEVVELGAHTANHPSMTSLSRAATFEEVTASRAYLTELLGAPPTSFSYPFGDNNRTARSVVARSGFDHAVAVRGDIPVTAGARWFEIPRLVAIDEPEEALGRRVEQAFAFGAGPS